MATSSVSKAKEELKKAEQRLMSKKAALREAERKERNRLFKRLMEAASDMDNLLSLDQEVLSSVLKKLNSEAANPEKIKQWANEDSM